LTKPKPPERVVESVEGIGEETLDAIDAIARVALPERWSRHSLQQALKNGYELRVCRDGGAIVAYLLSQDVVDETHIMQLAVSPAYRRQGMARALTQCLLRDKRHMHAICLEVRASNHTAQALYTCCGFVQIARRSGYYAARNGQPQEDAVIMQKML